MQTTTTTPARTKSRRAPYLARTIRIIGEQQRDTAIAAISNLPIDPDRPLVVTVSEERKVRKPDANSAMWAGVIKDIATQAWVDGRQYSADVWHCYFKREYLPEDDDPELAELATAAYRKWDLTPSGERVLVGSTTQLLVRGFVRYMQQVEAYGASLGVQFHVREA